MFETKNLSEIRIFEIENGSFGVTGYKENIFFTSIEGLRKYNTKLHSNDVLFKSNFKIFSFIYYHNKRLYFTHGEGSSSVSCCDEM